MIHAVLFDMDGVIFATESLYSQAISTIAKEMGYTMDMPFFIKTLGISKQECRRLYTEAFGDDFPFDEVTDRLFDFILDYNRKHGMPMKDGVTECLQALQTRGLKIVLATSSPRYVADELFASMPQLDLYFDGKVCGDEVTLGKPAPEIYQKAALLAGFPPRDCLGVEDSPSGLEAIRLSGAHSVMIPDLLPYSKALKPFTDHVLQSLRDLPALIDQLNKG